MDTRGADPPAAGERGPGNRPAAADVDGAPLNELFALMVSSDPATVERAWGECYERYSEKVWTRVFYVVRGIYWLKEPGEVAVDVTSELFARLPDALRKYREIGKAEAWLMQLALRAALRQKESITGSWSRSGRDRSGPTRTRITVDLEDVAGRIASEIDDAEMDAKFALERCMRLWEQDPARRPWIPYLELFLEGYGHDEIAERLGITAGTSRNWLWKIRRELGQMMPETEGSM